MCRSLLRFLRPKIKFIPLDESQWFHRQVGYSLLWWTFLHVAAHFVNSFNIERTLLRPVAAIQIQYAETGGITGHVMLLCMLLMYTTAHAKIRQQSFETFWYTHHLFIPFTLALYTHATGCFVRDTPEPYSPFDQPNWANHCLGYGSWRWTLPFGLIYFGERAWAFFRSRRTEAKIVRVIRHPSDALELQFVKDGFKYRPGQWIFLNVPAVSRGQWHPFTITSCPFDDYISVHIRQLGDWTRALGDALGAPVASKMQDSIDPKGVYEIELSEDQQLPTILVDGPYGAPAEDVFDNEVAVLIGTGIGVTPWASILKNIWHLRQQPNHSNRLRRVEFIWIARDIDSFEWFQNLLHALEGQGLDSLIAAPAEWDRAPEVVGSPKSMNYRGDEGFLRIHTYLTQKLDVNTAHNVVLNSVDQQMDPLTQLRSKVNFGRPNFKQLFTSMRDGIMNEQYMAGTKAKRAKVKIGVYFCGPNVAARDIHKACKAVRTKDVDFGFWKEHF